MGSNSDQFDFSVLVSSIRGVHEHLTVQASQAVNISLTLRNWAIGCYIDEYELHGADRASYGKKLLSELAKRLTAIQSSNCNRRQLYDYLRLYRVYPQIVRTASAQLQSLLPEQLNNYTYLAVCVPRTCSKTATTFGRCGNFLGTRTCAPR